MTSQTTRYSIDIDAGKRLFQCFTLFILFFLMGISLYPAIALMLHFTPAVHTALGWTLLILAAIVVFNYVYLIGLLVLRVIIPVPKEGFYPTAAGGRPTTAYMLYMFNILLVKARYSAPWCAYLGCYLANLFPLKFFFQKYFGPYTTSTSFGDSWRCIDPYFIEAGKNVQFGGFCLIAGHWFDHTGMRLAKVKIDDYALIGGLSMINAGVEIGTHAIVGMRSNVLPGTKIGPYEYWAGNPAKKIKNLPRPGAVPAEGGQARHGPPDTA